MSTLSLRFRSLDSRSTFIITWQNGEIVQYYNGKPSRSLLTEPPQSVVAFEAICRPALPARPEVAMHEPDRRKSSMTTAVSRIDEHAAPSFRRAGALSRQSSRTCRGL